MSPLATGCHPGTVPTWGSVPVPLAVRSLKTGVWAPSVHSHLPCFSCCLSHRRLINPLLSVWRSCFPDVLTSAFSLSSSTLLSCSASSWTKNNSSRGCMNAYFLECSHHQLHHVQLISLCIIWSQIASKGLHAAHAQKNSSRCFPTQRGLANLSAAPATRR